MKQISGAIMIVIGIIGFALTFLIKEEEDWNTVYRKQFQNSIYPMGEKRYLQSAVIWEKSRNATRSYLRCTASMLILVGILVLGSQPIL